MVIGDGMVGQWAAQTLAWRGAEVTLTGHHGYRLAMFESGALRKTIDAGKDDWIQMVGDGLPADLGAVRAAMSIRSATTRRLPTSFLLLDVKSVVIRVWSLRNASLPNPAR